MAVRRAKALARRAMRRAGYEVVRIPNPDRRYSSPSFHSGGSLPEGAAKELRRDNPRLEALQDRYRRSSLPMAERTMWRPRYLAEEVDLAHFRGDNSYVWQFRNVGDDARRSYYLYLRDIESRDRDGLLSRLDEDGAFGCWTFTYPGQPVVSRDLLDSINEIYFLDYHVGLLRTEGWTVLDVGAGYGRLAHRLLTAAPTLGSYICVDGVPESSFLSEYYLRFRGLADRSEVVALDELDAHLSGRRVDLAVNIHSFSEMSEAAIAGWLSVIASTSATWLLIVPNENDQLLTFEADGDRRDFSHLMAAHGYELFVQAPVFADISMCEMTAMHNQFFLYRRST